jgi:hypothetical protein
MLLITMREWFGPSRWAQGESRISGVPGTTVDIRLRGFVTKLPLGQALRRIKAYQSAFNERNSKVTAIEFELIQATAIDDLDDEEIEMSRVVLVEKLDETVEEMNARLA